MTPPERRGPARGGTGHSLNSVDCDDDESIVQAVDDNNVLVVEFRPDPPREHPDDVAVRRALAGARRAVAAARARRGYHPGGDAA